MINYEESKITQLLPERFANDPEVKAIAFSISNVIQKLLQYAINTGVYAQIDALPEEAIDLLAVELRAQYYDQTLTIEQKRSIVKNALFWHERAGTPYALEELVATIFGSGSVKEWFEYGGEPYFFRVQTDATMTEENISKFETVIKKAKNARSHMEALEIARSEESTVYVGGVFKQTIYAPEIREEGTDDVIL